MKDCTYVTPGAFAIATFKAPSKGGGRGGRPKRKLERLANVHTVNFSNPNFQNKSHFCVFVFIFQTLRLNDHVRNPKKNSPNCPKSKHTKLGHSGNIESYFFI